MFYSLEPLPYETVNEFPVTLSREIRKPREKYTNRICSPVEGPKMYAI
jgi:hypothetical protein